MMRRYVLERTEKAEKSHGGTGQFTAASRKGHLEERLAKERKLPY
jgi:hypothetical protein